MASPDLRARLHALGFADARILDDHLSDPHNGAQCSALFESGGKRFIYKPRSPETDIAWADFLAAMEAVLDMPMPGAVRPLPLPADGCTIVPCIENRDAGSATGIAEYYRRCGALLALCMLLGSRDLHMENIIADGRMPCVVDVETLLSATVRNAPADAAALCRSLAATHLLPDWMADANGENQDVGGLSAVGQNLPRLNGKPVPPQLYTEEILLGFRETCLAILRRRDAVMAHLDAFATVPLRWMLRPTALYQRFLNQLDALETQAQRLDSLQRLRIAYRSSGAAFEEKMRRACESEIAALLKGDIPHFFCLGSERCLRDADGIAAEDYFVLSPVEAARQRLEALSAGDLPSMEALIRQNLRCASAQITAAPICTAMEAFRLLEAQAIDAIPCSWMGLSLDHRNEACFQSIGFNLYSGLTGVLVFYAALYEAGGSAEVRETLQRRYAPYRQRFIESHHPLKASAATLSLSDGLAGHILALDYCARCTGDGRFREDAARLLTRFRFDGFSDFSTWDVYGGAAGLLVALPRLRGLGMENRLKEIAGQLGEELRKVQPALTGFGHGAAGLALALAAAQYLGGGDFRAESLRLLNWENQYYDEAKANWRDLRSPNQPAFMHGICSGAPGIGLARMQMLEYCADPAIRSICLRDIDRVRAALAYAKPLSRDCLCCGNAARIEAERCLSGETRSSALNTVPVLMHPLGTDDFPAGLMQGWSGIGYALARSMPASVHSLFYSRA